MISEDDADVMITDCVEAKYHYKITLDLCWESPLTTTYKAYMTHLSAKGNFTDEINQWLAEEGHALFDQTLAKFLSFFLSFLFFSFSITFSS